MKDYYRPDDIIISKIYLCKDIETKRRLVLEQMEMMTFKKGKSFTQILNKIEHCSNISKIDKLFTDLILVGEGMKVI